MSNSTNVVGIQYPTSGRHFFVDNQHPNTSDSNSGSEDFPWSTISKAMATVQPGDTVWIKDGTYVGGNFSSIVGTDTDFPSGTISFRAFPTHRPVLSTGTYGIRLTNSNDVLVEGILVEDVNQGLYFSGCTNITVRKCVIQDTIQEAVHFISSTTDCLIEDCQLFRIGQTTDSGNGQGIYLGSSDDASDLTARITVRNNYADGVRDDGCIVKDACFDCEVDGNHFFNCKRGIRIDGSGGIPGSNPQHVIKDNKLHDCEFQGFYAESGGFLACNNIIYDNGDVGFEVDNKNSTDGYVAHVYHNTGYNNTGVDFRFNDTNYEAKNNIGSFDATEEPDNIDARAEFFKDASGKDFSLRSGE